VIELMFRVQVAGVDVHSLQCYLDKNGIVTVVSQSLSRVGQFPVKDGSNLGRHVVRRSRIVLGDGLAPRKRSGTALFFSQIENRFFSEWAFFRPSRREQIFELVSGGQSGRPGPQSRVYKGFSSIPLLQKPDSECLGLALILHCVSANNVKKKLT
jgi:hypothetical protein